MRNFFIIISLLLFGVSAIANDADSLVFQFNSDIQQMHNRIDEMQLKIDTFDGEKDRFIDISRWEYEPILNEIFFKKIDYLQFKILSLDEFNDDDKLKYLGKTYNLLFKVKSYDLENYEKIMEYEEVVDNLPKIMSLAKKGQDKKFFMRNLDFAMKNITFFSGEPYAEEVLLKAAEKRPDLVLEQTDGYYFLPTTGDIITKASLNDPVTTARHLKRETRIRNYLELRDELAVKRLLEFADTNGNKAEERLNLFDHIVLYNLTPSEIDGMLQLESKLFEELVEAKIRPNHYGAYAVDRKLSEIATGWLEQTKNSGYSSHFFNRFKALSPEAMYMLLVYGETEITRGIFDRLYPTLMEKNNHSGLTLMNLVNREKVKTFIDLCDNYEQLDTFSNTFDVDVKEKILALYKSSQSQKDYDKHTLFAFNDQEYYRFGFNIATLKSKDVEEEIFYFLLDGVVDEEMQYKKNIRTTLTNFNDIKDYAFAGDILKYAAGKYPTQVLQLIDTFENHHYALEVIEELAKRAPLSIKEYLHSNNPVKELLAMSSEPAVKSIMEIYDKHDTWSRGYLFLDAVNKGRISIDEADELPKSPSKLFKALVTTSSRKNFLGDYSIQSELQYATLEYVRTLNFIPANEFNRRFAAVDQMTAQEIYFTMIYGQEEIFKNTFHRIYSKFNYKLGGKNGYAFLQDMGFSKYRDFLKLLAENGHLNSFLNTMSPGDRETLLISFISDLNENEGDLSEIIKVADALGAVQNTEILTLWQRTIRFEYERMYSENNYEGAAIYGLLASLCRDKTKVEHRWFSSVANAYNISPLNRVQYRELIDEYSGKNIQQYFFYNDQDGISSFANFLSQYRAGMWNVDDRGKYVCISSRAGNAVEIYANKPRNEEEGQKLIKSLFESKGISPTVVVHRGHSIHTKKTIDQLPASAKIIPLGSCGGYHHLYSALEKSPSAHIISTKQIGTMHVNDPMFKLISEKIRLGTDIVWPEFWAQMQGKVGNNPHFDDYIPPHQNIGAQFVQAYYKILGI